MSQQFGGIWTAKKLAVLKDYLKFYTTALKNQGFDLHYVDAFAGSGEHRPSSNADQETLIPHEDLIGSVKTALSVEPGFQHYHFNDIDPAFISELEQIKREYPDKQININRSDANVFVPEFFANMQPRDRAVLFLDPFSTQLDWETLLPVAESQKTDLWLLFPISTILRMTPKDGSKIKSEWKSTLDRLLGTSDWEDALYQPVTGTLGLFDDTKGVDERINVEELRSWVTTRLREIFQFVADPVLLNNNNRPLFLFYFAVSNPNKSAWGLARKATTYIVSKHNTS